MAYATYNEVIRRYPLLETATAGGDYDAQALVCSDYIYFAEMEINSRLGSHFATPFSNAGPTVKDLCIDLAYYRAIRYTDPDRAEKLRAAVDGRIEAIKAGGEYLYTSSGTVMAPDASGEQVWSSNEDYHPVHSMLDAEENEIDEDRLDDEADERD